MTTTKHIAIYRATLLLIATFLFTPTLDAQQPDGDALFNLKRLTGRVATFGIVNPQEKVYLHFDNTAYFQGDNIYYKAYVVNATSLQAAQSKILYVELLSPTGVVLKQQKLKIENGSCHGSFSLIDESVPYARSLRGTLSYPSGYYEVRAYTREMQNFGDAYLFSRIFPVYEKPEKEGDFENPRLTQYKTDIQKKRPEAAKLKNVNIDFYPEGGHLVKGVPCKVAFKAYDKEGQPLQLSGTIENQAVFSTYYDGMGVFDFTPGDKSNTAKVEYEGKSYAFDLPKAVKNGYSLQVNALADSIFTFTIQGSPELLPRLLGYTLMCREKVLLFDTLTIGSTPGTRAHSLKGYPAGVYQLTLFSEQGDVAAERLFFVSTPLSQTISVSPIQHKLKPFEKIRLQLSIDKGMAAASEARFSVAVRDGSNYGSSYNDNILTNLLLSSELRGFIRNPSYYFESNDRKHRRALDLLMMVQGWRRYQWRTMAHIDSIPSKHYMENGITLDGRVLSRIRKKPIADLEVNVVAHNPDRSLVQRCTATSAADGTFGFRFDDFYGEWDLSLSIKDDDGKAKDARIVIERSQKPAPLAYGADALFLPKHIAIREWNDSLLEASEANMMSGETDIMLPDAMQLKEVVITQKRKYIDFCTFKAFDSGKDTEEELDMGNYTTKVLNYLQNLGYDIEIDPEYIDSSTNLTHIGLDEEEYVYKMLPICRMKNGLVFWENTQTGKWEKQKPTDNSWYIDMENVKSVIVYDSPTAYTSLPFVMRYSQTIQKAMTEYKCHRLYVVQLIPYDIGDTQLFEKGKRNTTLMGYSQIKEFYSPSYSDGVLKGETDYRRTLYWNPDVQPDSLGNVRLEFYNNSRCEQFSVSAQGITPQGVPMMNSKE